MSRVPSLSSPFLLGFDEIERVLDRVTKAADGYPPYNIERLPRDEHDPERLRITLAVAGFTREQLDVSIEENQLVIRGKQMDDTVRQFLHRGIAARQFQRSFLLADGMEVQGAFHVPGEVLLRTRLGLVNEIIRHEVDSHGNPPVSAVRGRVA